MVQHISPMAFHNERFPENISYGSRGGAAYSTNIMSLDSGHEVRSARWSSPRHRYDASFGIEDLDDIYAIIKFFHARLGTANGFRWKDHLDYSTAANGRDAAAWNDQPLGLFQLAPDSIQMRKAYTNGSNTTYRGLTKIVAGTTKVGWGGSAKTSGWSIDEQTGIITITDASANAQGIYAGCEFDVPVRFGEELDDGLMLSHDAFNLASIPSIPIIEIKEPVVMPDDYFYGGAKEYVSGDDVSHSIADGRVIWTAMSSGTVTVQLPQPTNYYATGGAYFYALHKGYGGTLVIKNHAGTTLASMAPTLGALFVIVISSGGIRSFEVIA